MAQFSHDYVEGLADAQGGDKVPDDSEAIGTHISGSQEEAKSPHRATMPGSRQRDPQNETRHADMPTTAQPPHTPTILTASLYEPLSDMNPRQYLQWLRKPYPKCVIRVFDEAANNPRLIPSIHDLLTHVLTQVTDSNTQIDPPHAIQPSRRIPNIWLLHDISETAARSLIAQGVHCTPLITFQVLPFAFTPPTLLFSLEGLHTENPDEVHELVHRVWSDPDTLRALDLTTITDYEGEDVYPLPNDILPTIDSLRVTRKHSRDGPATSHTFHIEIDPHDIDMEDAAGWYALRTALSSLTYSSPETGHGTIATPLSCSLCHSAGHARPDCPFPSQTGWLGPRVNDDPGQLNGRAYHIE
ncbi:hypothetical protein FA95DRAFT_1659693 [Auriscalpium vulgare]|uniref:Uncharacterized protein n=1 Tax=Auriscalpium vulgare TaxID=40419 RepID=A0ACB8RVT1_9AGAM|nr:hypothetical protein FA95DRAFT_1659693 [Auriscalpium vulgare]